jgi:hypothetical protein
MKRDYVVHPESFSDNAGNLFFTVGSYDKNGRWEPESDHMGFAAAYQEMSRLNAAEESQ